jgi:hypothetical protein
MIWEDRGPGKHFGEVVIELGFSNFYIQESDGLSKKRGDRPGWNPSPRTQRLLLENYRTALYEDQFFNRDRESLAQCNEYILTINQGVEHNKRARVIDAENAGQNHGDRVIADALACWLLGRRVLPAQVVPEIPRGCLAWRRKRSVQVAAARSAPLGFKAKNPYMRFHSVSVN